MSSDPLTPRGNRPMLTPIVNAVNYEYASFELLRQIADGQIEGYTYHRDNNPTVRAVERQLARLEDAEDCILCTTGMAAGTMVYLTWLGQGDHLVLFHDIYGAHYKVGLILERMGIEITWLDAGNSGDLYRHMKPNTRMILCETPSNPLCKIVDIAELAGVAHQFGALLVVDNTFATPCHQKPLALGADVVLHSATKALGGHNDLMAGALACSRENYEKLWFTRQAIGTTLDAGSASLLERGLKTFQLRAERMSANALAMAEFLAGHPKVTRVLYPGLEHDPSHAVASKQMTGGFGGVLA
ncbi:MAG: trans-sulfuration enzyme family protein, partial [Thermoguttaceae bacterium]